MRPTFGRAYIENEFRQIADGLSDLLTVYLIGGGAMSLRDLKAATKDIDLVSTDGDAYGQFWAVLMDLGNPRSRSARRSSVPTLGERSRRRSGPHTFVRLGW